MKTFFTATIASVLFAGIAAAGTVNFSNFTSLWEVQSGGTPVGGGFVAVGTGSDIDFSDADLAKAGLTSNFVQFGAGTTFGDEIAAFGFDGFFSGAASADGGSADFNGKPIWLVAGTGADAATSDALLVIDSGKNFGPDAPLYAEKVELRTIVQKINASGKIQPEESVQITSTITGWITEITVIEGDTVEPGQHLISIDEKQIRPRYNNAVSQVKSSEANLRKVQSQMDRTQSLFSQKLISKQELEQIEASYQIALSQSEQANANLLSAEDELSKTRLTAPKYGLSLIHI